MASDVGRAGMAERLSASCARSPSSNAPDRTALRPARTVALLGTRRRLLRLGNPLDGRPTLKGASQARTSPPEAMFLTQLALFIPYRLLRADHRSTYSLCIDLGICRAGKERLSDRLMIRVAIQHS